MGQLRRHLPHGRQLPGAVEFRLHLLEGGGLLEEEEAADCPLPVPDQPRRDQEEAPPLVELLLPSLILGQSLQQGSGLGEETPLAKTGKELHRGRVDECHLEGGVHHDDGGAHAVEQVAQVGGEPLGFAEALVEADVDVPKLSLQGYRPRLEGVIGDLQFIGGLNEAAESLLQEFKLLSLVHSSSLRKGEITAVRRGVRRRHRRRRRRWDREGLPRHPRPGWTSRSRHRNPHPECRHAYPAW